MNDLRQHQQAYNTGITTLTNTELSQVNVVYKNEQNKIETCEFQHICKKYYQSLYGLLMCNTASQLEWLGRGTDAIAMYKRVLK